MVQEEIQHKPAQHTEEIEPVQEINLISFNPEREIERTQGHQSEPAQHTEEIESVQEIEPVQEINPEQEIELTQGRESEDIQQPVTATGGGWVLLLNLTFQCIGVVYGDIATSPLYVFSSTFMHGIKNKEDILGVLSLIIYTITLLPLIKYIFIVLHATDDGNGGTFALYSLLGKHINIGLGINQPHENQNLQNNQSQTSKLASKLEGSNFAKYFLLCATILGSSMVIGDGILTPCISVLSAMSGIKEATTHMTEDAVVWASVGIIVLIFMVQRFGTDKIGYTFAPIILLWFTSIAIIGLYNIVTYDASVLKAINPKYIIAYFQRNKTEAWISLGGVVLAVTGTEALFADVGHFSVRSIQLSMCVVVYPALILSYMGQAAFLSKNNELVSDSFYKSIPGPVYWPMFVLALLASIIASQAMITGSFSTIEQSLSFGCFPNVQIVHTSTKYPGQVYIPMVNYILGVACVLVTIGFRTTTKIGNAYGIAVMFVMILTSIFMILIMLLVWKTHKFLIIAYIIVIVSPELIYLSSALYKFNQGGYLPLAFATVLATLMFVYHTRTRRNRSPTSESNVIVTSD